MHAGVDAKAAAKEAATLHSTFTCLAPEVQPHVLACLDPAVSAALQGLLSSPASGSDSDTAAAAAALESFVSQPLLSKLDPAAQTGVCSAVDVFPEHGTVRTELGMDQGHAARLEHELQLGWPWVVVGNGPATQAPGSSASSKIHNDISAAGSPTSLALSALRALSGRASHVSAAASNVSPHISRPVTPANGAPARGAHAPSQGSECGSEAGYPSNIAHAPVNAGKGLAAQGSSRGDEGEAWYHPGTSASSKKHDDISAVGSPTSLALSALSGQASHAAVAASSVSHISADRGRTQHAAVNR